MFSGIKGDLEDLLLKSKSQMLKYYILAMQNYLQYKTGVWPIFNKMKENAKVRSSYGLLAYFSDIFIIARNEW